MRASARPPWRTLLLALLLAAGCTTAPASRESAAGTTTAPAVRQPAAGSTQATLAPVKLSGVVRLEPGLSGGLVTVVGLTGQSRPEPVGAGPSSP
jgi:hypothetical protein